MALQDMYVLGLLIYRFEGELAIFCAALSKDDDTFGGIPNAPTGLPAGIIYDTILFLRVLLTKY